MKSLLERLKNDTVAVGSLWHYKSIGNDIVYVVSERPDSDTVVYHYDKHPKSLNVVSIFDFKNRTIPATIPRSTRVS